MRGSAESEYDSHLPLTINATSPNEQLLERSSKPRSFLYMYVRTAKATECWFCTMTTIGSQCGPTTHRHVSSWRHHFSSLW